MNKDAGVLLYYDSVLQFSTTSDGLILNSGARISRNGNSNNTIMEVTNAQYAKSIYFGGWDNGANTAGVARVRNSNDNLHLDSGSAGITYINAYCTGNTFIRDLYPIGNDSYDLGSNSYKWDDVYATNGTIQTSDKNKKNTIVDSDLGLSFIEKLKPVSYKFNSGTRTHYGLIAQDVETVLSDISKPTTDFAGFIKTDLPDEYYKEAEPHKKIVDAFNLVDQLTNQNLTNLQRQSEMEGFLSKANEMIEDANLSIKNYNKLIKEYETKGFFGSYFFGSYFIIGIVAPVFPLGKIPLFA